MGQYDQAPKRHNARCIVSPAHMRLRQNSPVLENVQVGPLTEEQLGKLDGTIASMWEAWMELPKLHTWTCVE